MNGLNNQQTSNFDDRDAIRIKAKKINGETVEWKSMAVDPRITSYDNLVTLLQRAFNIPGEFEISYLLPKSHENHTRPDVYLILASDWDLDAAFHTASLPFLVIKVDSAKKKGIVLDEWALLETTDAPPVQDIKSNSLQLPFGMSLRHEVYKTFTRVKDVFIDYSRKPPLKEAEWLGFLDDSGRVTSHEDLRIRVFYGGIDPMLRKEVWMHILGVYPIDLTAQERKRFLMMRYQVYHVLKQAWLSRAPEDISKVVHMVQKDVLRTDRYHEFFNVPEDHPNLVSLFNILTTYAVNNTDVSYCQGMSDLAAPFLVVMEDETAAFWCFCALMNRVKNNFLLHGSSMMRKFHYVEALIKRTDSELHQHLHSIEAENMYFCYRMLLLELKREFPFDEALSILEITWSSFPPCNSDAEHEVEFYYKLLQLYVPPGSGGLTGRSSPYANEGLYVPNGIQLNGNAGNAAAASSSSSTKPMSGVEPLPHPKFMNDGCPFVLFLCLAILLNHRDDVLQYGSDYNSLGMYFDKKIRKHESDKVLVRARSLYVEYIRSYLDGQTCCPEETEQLSETPHGVRSGGAQC